jgi:hypothetical protein
LCSKIDSHFLLSKNIKFNKQKYILKNEKKKGKKK